jgi:hypothetical protein
MLGSLIELKRGKPSWKKKGGKSLPHKARGRYFGTWVYSLSRLLGIVQAGACNPLLLLLLLALSFRSLAAPKFVLFVPTSVHGSNCTSLIHSCI